MVLVQDTVNPEGKRIYKQIEIYLSKITTSQRDQKNKSTAKRQAKQGNCPILPSKAIKNEALK